MLENSSRFTVHSSQRKTIFLSFLCLLFFILLSGCAKREIRNINSQGKSIICFGDSITFGYGADSGEDFPSALGKIITDRQVINAGIDGDTTSEALKRLQSDVLERQPYLVIVEFGGNDFLRKIPMEETLKNIEQMIDSIQEEGAMVALADISAGMFMKEYRAAFAKVARQKNAIFIPSILSGIITNPSMKSDFIHPNALGYKMIAERIYGAISPYFNPVKVNK